jgi:hypothetical protein
MALTTPYWRFEGVGNVMIADPLIKAVRIAPVTIGERKPPESSESPERICLVAKFFMP